MNIRVLTNTVLVLCGIFATGVIILLLWVADEFYGKTENTSGIILLKRQTNPIKRATRFYYNIQQKKNDSLSAISQQLFYFNILLGKDTVIFKVLPSLFFKKQIGDSLNILKATGYFSNEVRYYVNEQ
jgi:hypothetical protein